MLNLRIIAITFKKFTEFIYKFEQITKVYLSKLMKVASTIASSFIAQVATENFLSQLLCNICVTLHVNSTHMLHLFWSGSKKTRHSRQFFHHRAKEIKRWVISNFIIWIDWCKWDSNLHFKRVSNLWTRRMMSWDQQSLFLKFSLSTELFGCGSNIITKHCNKMVDKRQNGENNTNSDSLSHVPATLFPQLFYKSFRLKC